MRVVPGPWGIANAAPPGGPWFWARAAPSALFVACWTRVIRTCSGMSAQLSRIAGNLMISGQVSYMLRTGAGDFRETRWGGIGPRGAARATVAERDLCICLSEYIGLLDLYGCARERNTRSIALHSTCGYSICLPLLLRAYIPSTPSPPTSANHANLWGLCILCHRSCRGHRSQSLQMLLLKI